MDKEQLEVLQRKYEFEKWRSLNRLDRDLVVRRLRLPAGLIAGLDPAQVREIDPGDGTRLLRASWTPSGQVGVLLFVDIRECESLERAHEVLLELLANMQAPDVQRLEDAAPGDVAFARQTDTAVVFARGNIAVSIWNGGETVVPVNDAASDVDAWITKQPD